MNFASDNAGPAHPAILAAMTAANAGHSPGYGAEAAMERVQAMVREIFEAPEAAVRLVATGTAANSLLLATLARPWETIFCARTAHVQEDECNAPEFFTGGAKLTLVEAPDGRMDPDALRAAIAAEEGRGVHGPKRGPVTLTETSEKGTTHGPARIAELAAIARAHGLPVHMDGARLSNALAHCGARPAGISWQAGVDALSLGATKNGCVGLEIVVLFDPAQAQEFDYRRKRAGHLFSKHRYLSAQAEAWLSDGLWLDLAARANAAAALLAQGLGARGVELLYPVEANLMFFRAPRGLHRRLHEGGAQYYLWGGDLEGGNPDDLLTGRLVCDWSADAAAVERFLALI
ncbi:MAG: low specificity L-threonine aldolase [Rubellimicrobium sp.]|nr:low specificity L-threonine aldolase [Rubellimicrobium sp.]